jgi:hypothetical protein
MIIHSKKPKIMCLKLREIRYVTSCFKLYSALSYNKFIEFILKETVIKPALLLIIHGRVIHE